MNADYGGRLTQGCSFLAGVAAINNAVGSLVVYASESSREDGAR